MSKKLVEVTRSDYEESSHFGVGALVNSNGKIIKKWGDTSLLIYPRSSLKPIQSLNLYKDGFLDKYKLSEKQIAISTSSHFADEIHVDLIEDWLKKINLNEDKLACGEDWPWTLNQKFRAKETFNKKRRIFHNCSGKHCAHLAVCVDRGLEIENYNSKNHTLQLELFNLIEKLINFKPAHIGIDGCTLPNPLIPLEKFAHLMAKFSDFSSLDNIGAIAEKIFRACVNNPDYAGGEESDNTKLTKLFKGKAFFKNGAEGVFVAIIPDIKSSIVVKILDGNPVASSTAIAGMISELNIIDKSLLTDFLNKPVYNSTNTQIGNVKWIG